MLSNQNMTEGQVIQPKDSERPEGPDFRGAYQALRALWLPAQTRIL